MGVGLPRLDQQLHNSVSSLVQPVDPVSVVSHNLEKHHWRLHRNMFQSWAAQAICDPGLLSKGAVFEIDVQGLAEDGMMGISCEWEANGWIDFPPCSNHMYQVMPSITCPPDACCVKAGLGAVFAWPQRGTIYMYIYIFWRQAGTTNHHNQQISFDNSGPLCCMSEAREAIVLHHHHHWRHPWYDGQTGPQSLALFEYIYKQQNTHMRIQKKPLV